MAYTLAFTLNLGGSQTGLALKARVFDTAGVQVGGDITTGFTEVGSGVYRWLGPIPTGHRGWVQFLTTGGVFKAEVPINPEETDPLQSAVPGTYLSGTAGAVLGRVVDQTTTARWVSMSVRTVMTDAIPEKTTWRYSGVLNDELAAPIPAASLSTLKLTLYNLADLAILNGVSAVSILNTDRGTVDALGNLAITFLPADSPIVDATLGEETHIALIEWTYGAKAGRHEVEFKVRNMALVA